MPGIGRACAGAHGDEQRVFRIAELLLHELLDGGERRVSLGLELRRVGLLVCVVIRADFRRDRESGRHRQAQRRMTRHLGEVGTLASQQVLHGLIPVGIATAKGINVFGHANSSIFLENCARIVESSRAGLG